MPLTRVYLAEEGLSLPPEQREKLARLPLDSIADTGQTDDKTQTMLRLWFEDLKPDKDKGLSFDEVFDEKA